MAKYKIRIKDGLLSVKVKLDGDEEINIGQMSYFSSKIIKGFLRVSVVTSNSAEYCGSVGDSLYNRLRSPLSKYEFSIIMEQLADLDNKLKIHSLIVNNLVLDTRGIYINNSTNQLQFVYLPTMEPQNNGDIKELMNQVICGAQPKDERDMNYFSRFSFFLRDMRHFDGDMIKSFIKGEIAALSKRADVVQQQVNTAVVGTSPAHVFVDEATGLLGDEGIAVSIDEATGLLNERGEGFSNGQQNHQVYVGQLYRCVNNETIIINKPVFRIGKELNGTDYCVNNNDAVSRKHIDILTRGQHFFVVDLNSKNRTFINNKVIPVRQEIEIFNGDKLRLANEEFEFRV